MLVQYAITWHITLETQSGIMMTISILCGFLPTLLISPFAGVWADRYNRKMLIVLSDSFIAVSTLALAILFLLGYDAIWLLFLASSLRSLGAGVQTPAVGAFLPQIVPEDKLTRINGLNSSIQSLVTLVSPLLSGALMSVSTIDSIFFIDVFTAAIAVSILLFFLNVPKHAKAIENDEISYFAEMKEGVKYIYHHSFINNIFIHCAIYYVLISPLCFLTPLQVTRSFGDDVWRLTVIEVTFSIGMIFGGIIIASWGGFKNRLHTMALSFLVIAVCTTTLGAIPSFPMYSIIMAFIGVMLPIFNTPFTVLLQEKVEEDYMGRVFGVLSMISSSVMPLAMLAFGPLADFVKIEWLLIVTGLLMLIQGVLMIRSKTLYQAGKPVQADKNIRKD
jgi:DHA3 family macrolide efflux protein-like MFS transporter